MIGKAFGTRIASRRNVGYVLLLTPTPELWMKSILTRTQIVQDTDQSYIIFRLNLKPGDVVVESGTGSGAMSIGIMRTIAPHGHLYSYEYNEERATAAAEIFHRAGCDHLCTVQHRNVCKDGFDSSLRGKVDSVSGSALAHAVRHLIAALPPTLDISGPSPAVGCSFSHPCGLEAKRNGVQLLAVHGADPEDLPCAGEGRFLRVSSLCALASCCLCGRANAAPIPPLVQPLHDGDSGSSIWQC